MTYPNPINSIEHDAERRPVVWEGLFSYVFVIHDLLNLTSTYRLFASGNIRPITYDKTYTLERVTDGLKALERRETWGKAVVRVRENETARARL